MRPGLTLLLLALLAFWPRLDLAEWRQSEAQRVQIAHEMVASGDYFVPQLGGEQIFAKPPLHYWILAALLHLADDKALLRLPSVLGFWSLAMVAFAAMRRWFSGLSAWFAALGILLSPIVLFSVPSAEIDPVFAALTGISIIWLAEGACFGPPGKLVAAGVVGGLALLDKGPPYLMFLAGAALVWARRLRLRGVAAFVTPLLLVPLAYYVPLFVWRDGLGEVFAAAGEESIGRIAWYDWSAVGRLPEHLASAMGMVMPLGWWTFHEFRGDREMRETVVGREEAFLRMCAAPMVSAVLVLMLFPSRPTRYMLPGVPLFVVGVAAAMASYARHGLQPSRVLARVVAGAGVAASIALLGAPWLWFPWQQSTPVMLLALAVAPMWVRTRRQVAVYALVIPLIAAWTVFLDYETRYLVSPRALNPATRILQRELQRIGAADLAAYGHVPANLGLSLSHLPGDERRRRSPTARFLLMAESDAGSDTESGRAAVAGYRDRVRIRVAEKTIVLRERQ